MKAFSTLSHEKYLYGALPIVTIRGVVFKMIQVVTERAAQMYGSQQSLSERNY